MEIFQSDDDGLFRILHAGKVVKAGPFDTDREADNWADMWIDDQVFDTPNTLSPPLKYEE